MEETLNENEMNSTDKALRFLKNNILNFLLVCIYGVFLVKDLIKIVESGKTVLEIVADTALAYFMGLATNIIMRYQGQAKAMASASYLATQKEYGAEIEKTDSHIDELDDFCEVKNEQRIKKAQKGILRQERIKFDDFENKPKSEVCGTDKKMLKCWDKAQHVHIQMITPENLLSETDSNYDKGKKDQTLAEHNRSKNIWGAVNKIWMAFIFGYFSIQLVAKANILWSCIQVAIWLMWGIMSYLQEYFYIIQVYKQKIYRKIKYLKEFNNTKGVNTNGIIK